MKGLILLIIFILGIVAGQVIKMATTPADNLDYVNRVCANYNK